MVSCKLLKKLEIEFSNRREIGQLGLCRYFDVRDLEALCCRVVALVKRGVEGLKYERFVPFRT